MPYLGNENGYARNELAHMTKLMEDCFRDYTRVLDIEGSPEKPVNKARAVVAILKRIQYETKSLYSSDPLREPVIPAGSKEYLKRLYDRAFRTIEEAKKVKNYDGNREAEDCLRLINDPALMAGLQEDYQDLQKGAVQAEEGVVDFALAELLGEDITQPDSEVLNNGPQYFGEHEHLSSYNKRTMIPDAIQVTGNAREIAEFYIQNQANLQEFEVDYLRQRVQNIYFLKNFAEKQKLAGKQITKVEEAGDNILMPNLKLAAKQDTGNGCWSCSYQLLLQSRGVFLDQMNIRSYRPEISVEEATGFTWEAKSGMLTDRPNSPGEYGDLVLSTMANTALRSVTLTIDHDRIGADTRADFEKQFTEVVTNALKVNKSPVAFSDGGHFLTIVGIRDGKFCVKDSTNENPNQTDLYEASDFYDKAEYVKNALGSWSISADLTFLQDLNVTEELECSFKGTDFEEVKYIEGELVSEGNHEISTNKNGECFTKQKNLESGLGIGSSIYLPRKLEAPEPMLIQQGEPQLLRPLCAMAYNGPEETVFNDCTKNAELNKIDEMETQLAEEAVMPLEERIKDPGFRKYVEEILGESIPAEPRELPEPFGREEPVFAPLTGWAKFWAGVKRFFTGGRVDDFRTHQEEFDRAHEAYENEKREYEATHGKREDIEAGNKRYTDFLDNIRELGLDAVEEKVVRNYNKLPEEAGAETPTPQPAETAPSKPVDKNKIAERDRNIEQCLNIILNKDSLDAKLVYDAKKYLTKYQKQFHAYLADHPDTAQLIKEMAKAEKEAKLNNEQPKPAPDRIV